jgi:hypothetical protein
MSAVSRREAGSRSSPVLLDSVPQIARHSGVQAARPASKNVDAIVAIHRMPQEWTKPSRETTKREDDPSAFGPFALCFLPYALFFAPCPLLFALCPFLSSFLYVVIPNRAVCGGPEGPAVRLLVPSPFSLRCHPERGAFCRRGTCCSILLLPTSSSRCSFQITRQALWRFPAPASASPNHSHSALWLRVFQPNSRQRLRSHRVNVAHACPDEGRGL